MDRACDAALSRARMRFGANEDGYLTYIEDNDRTRDSIRLELSSIHFVGSGWEYNFAAWVYRTPEEEY